MGWVLFVLIVKERMRFVAENKEEIKLNPKRNGIHSRRFVQSGESQEVHGTSAAQSERAVKDVMIERKGPSPQSGHQQAATSSARSIALSMAPQSSSPSSLVHASSLSDALPDAPAIHTGIRARAIGVVPSPGGLRGGGSSGSGRTRAGVQSAEPNEVRFGGGVGGSMTGLRGGVAKCGGSDLGPSASESEL